MRGSPHDAGAFTWNKVLVFNLGFDRKGPTRRRTGSTSRTARSSFYRVGFYDNIFDTDRMSLYVEIGFPRDGRVDVESDARARARRISRARGVVTDHQLVAEHSVVMDPAYVHITQARSPSTARADAACSRAHGVYSIGRYGGWTYCSIEDNIVEARALAATLGELL